MSELIDIERGIHAQSVESWHHLHRNPELSMREYNTADYIERALRETTGVDRVKRVDETGVWAELVGTASRQGPERTLVLRGDMDALPIQEKNELPFRSAVPGVMHACGHDVHTASLLASVRILEQYRDRIPGTVWFFFQPGEEVMGGALTFLADTEIDFERVSGAVGIHVAGNLEAGKIRLKEGPVLASADTLHFRILGESGHAAYPAAARDAVVAAANLIVQLQTLVSREVGATDSAVLTLGRIAGGTKDNIIAQEVRIDGTLRTLSKEVRAHLQQAIRRVCDGIGLSLRVTIELEIEQGSVPLVNDGAYVKLAERAAKRVLGEDSVSWSDVPGLAGEDFAYFLDRVPGAFVFIGSQTPGGPPAKGHTPEFYTDKDALRVGSLLLSSVALEFFGVDY
ncbi:MAG TPA: M20 family metallopeptidase [Pseudoflavonifractor sp.]|nr:M20 family metallopeptidase [Pseudoflavonifractor sp.]